MPGGRWATYDAAVAALTPAVYLPLLGTVGAIDYTDHSGNAVTVTKVGTFAEDAAMDYSNLLAPVFAAGKYLSVPAMLASQTNWTIEWWQYAYDREADQVVFSERGTSGNDRVSMVQEVSSSSNYRPTAYYQADSGSLLKSQPGNGLSNYRGWNHMVLQRTSGTSGLLRLYINGGRRGSDTFNSTAVTMTNASRDMRIGADKITGGGFRGRICRFAVYLTVPLNSASAPDDTIWAEHYELGVFENPDPFFHPTRVSDVFDGNSYVKRRLPADAPLVSPGTKYATEIASNVAFGQGIIASNQFSGKLWDVPEDTPEVRVPYLGGRYVNSRADHEAHWQSNGHWPIDDRIPGNINYGNPTDGPILITQKQADGSRRYLEMWQGRRGFCNYVGVVAATATVLPGAGTLPAATLRYAVVPIRRSDGALGPAATVTATATLNCAVALQVSQPIEQSPITADKFDFAIFKRDVTATVWQRIWTVTNPADTATSSTGARLNYTDDGSATPDTSVKRSYGQVTTTSARFFVPDTQPFTLPVVDASLAAANGQSVYFGGVHVFYTGVDTVTDALTGCTTLDSQKGRIINPSTVSTAFAPSYDTGAYPMEGFFMSLGNEYLGPGLTQPDINKSKGTYRDQPSGKQDWGSAASGIPVWAGVITLREMVAGHIPHGIRCALARSGASFVYPASRSDGAFVGSQYIPQGTIFRFPATFNVDTLGGTVAKAHSFLAAIARAIRDYGMCVTDTTGGGIALFVESPSLTGRDYQFQYLNGSTFGEYFDNNAPSFPWSQLVAVDPAYVQTRTIGPAESPSVPSRVFQMS